MRIALIAAVIFALFHAVGAPYAAEPLSGDRVLGSQLRLSQRLIGELDKQRTPQNPNVVISPASLAGVMALLDIGADEKMRTAIFNTLGLTPSLGHAPVSDLASLRATAAKATQTKSENADFALANSIVFDPQAKLYDKAIAEVRASGAEVSIAPLSDPATIRQINGWVASKTNQLIPNILPEQPLPPGLVAVNALYFKGKWATPFAKENTQPRKFHAPDTELEVPMMAKQAHFNIRRSGRFVAVELPYLGERYAMVIVTTADRPAKFAEFSEVSDWLGGAGFEAKLVSLSMPRFKLEAGEELLDPLKAIGLAAGTDSPTAFEGFSAIPQEISRIVQKTYTRVDEEGTEAAAATAVIAVATAMRPQADPEIVNIDKPFLFGLRDRETGLLLMSGYIARPSPGQTAGLDPDPVKKFASLKQ